MANLASMLVNRKGPRRGLWTTSKPATPGMPPRGRVAGRAPCRRHRGPGTFRPCRFQPVAAPVPQQRHAELAKLADAPDLGSGARKGMGVRLPRSAPGRTAAAGIRSVCRRYGSGRLEFGSIVIETGD